MAGLIGINGTGDGEISPASLQGIGSAWERLVLRERFDLNAYVDALHARGINVLGVIARESLASELVQAERWPYEEWLDSLRPAEAHSLDETPPFVVADLGGVMTYAQAAQLYGGRYGTKLDALQVGNESDHVSPSSWTMTHADLNSLLFAFGQEFPRTKIVGPGLVSGDPNWVRGIDLDLIDALGVHGYGQRPGGTAQDWAQLPGNFGDINDLIARYSAEAPGKQIWITEIGLTTTEVSLEFQARYCEAMMGLLKRHPNTAAGFWFCVGDWMVPEFGLFAEDGTPKLAAAAFTRVTGGPWAETEPGGGSAADPKFDLGFAKWAALEPGLLGRPLTDERNTGFPGWQVQPTDRGVLQWHADDGHIFVTHDGRVFRWEEDWTKSEEVFV